MNSVLLAFLWILAAQVIAFLPSRDHHWRAAYVLMVAGTPIVVFLYLENGIWIALLGLVAGMSILRYPVIYGYRRLRRIMGRPVGE